MSTNTNDYIVIDSLLTALNKTDFGLFINFMYEHAFFMDIANILEKFHKYKREYTIFLIYKEKYQNNTLSPMDEETILNLLDE